MSDAHRFIEVIAHSVANRNVESFQTEIHITVTNRKRSRQSCFEESLKLRDEVIEVLRKAGISEDRIQEGGGDHAWYYDENWKRISHVLLISHKDISKLIKAMGKVERLFYAKKESIFSPLKRTFSMNAPQARYSNENQTVEQFLKSAISEARKKADILATEAGLQIKGVMTVIEESETDASRNSGSMSSDADYMLDAESSENYTVVSPQRKSASRQFRVRFAVQEI